MQFDPDNHIVKRCALGMDLEAAGKKEEAFREFQHAWQEATSDFEKFIAAHYLARHQKTPADKLRWDESALDLAVKIEDSEIKASFPSLYLNIAKDYEDLGDTGNAVKNYELAYSFIDFLTGDGYGKMIRAGIESGLKRVGR